MQQLPLPYYLENLKLSLSFIGPEIALTVGFCLMIILELIFRDKKSKIVPFAGIVTLLVSLLLLGLQRSASDLPLFLGMIDPDGVSLVLQWVFGISGLLTIAVSLSSPNLEKESKGMGEYYIVVVGMILGLNFLSMATNLLMMYVSLELVSISSYVLTAYTRLNRKSAEGSLKYLIYGAFSSAIMIYGMSWLYGLTGTLHLSQMDLSGVDPVIGGVILFLVIAGFLFKVSALPFHFWAPDVYEGAPYPVAGFFSVAPKAAGFAVLWHFIAGVFPEAGNGISLTPIVINGLLVVAMATMTLGNLAALLQSRLRRMLAWSSIAHAGYLLLALAAQSEYGVAAMTNYLVIYAAMNLLAFWLAGAWEEAADSPEIDSMAGRAKEKPVFLVLFTLAVVALTGLPPTAGFTGKFYLFSAVMEAWQGNGNILLLIALIVAIVNTVISLFYYLRVPGKMLLSKVPENAKPVAAIPKLQMAIAFVLAVPTLALGVIGFDQLFNWIRGLVG